jgi:hypothetical protein
MIDPRNQQRVTINRGERGGGHILLLRDRLPEVREVLTAHGVPFWESEMSFSSNGGPYVTSITLSVKANVELVQQLLDSMS